MSSSFDFAEIRHFATGTEGEPGNRVFYLQAATETEIVTLRLEKQQVDALAHYLQRIAEQFELVAETPEWMPDLVQPLIPEWVVGGLMVAIDQSESRIIVIAEEIEPEDQPEGAETAQARFSLTVEQAAGFVHGAQAVVAGGRPRCPLCNAPIDPDGHFCPRMN